MASPALTQDKKTIANDLSKKIIGAAIEVHRILGPGLLESAYEECTYHELSLQKVVLQRQVPLPIQYKAKNLDCGYRLDLVVGQLVIVEFKAVEKIEPIHEAQLLTYLKLSNLWLGLLINFNVTELKDGIHRIVNG